MIPEDSSGRLFRMTLPDDDSSGRVFRKSIIRKNLPEEYHLEESSGRVSFGRVFRKSMSRKRLPEEYQAEESMTFCYVTIKNDHNFFVNNNKIQEIFTITGAILLNMARSTK
jgi:hypothetical protein